MAKYGLPIAEELEKESEQPKSSRVPFRRRWLAGFGILWNSLACLLFISWSRDAMNAMEGANAVLRYGCALVAIVFVFIFMPLMAYEMACWVVLRPWNKERILKSLQSDQRASDEIETKPAEADVPRERA
jgi:uncharacterized membrane protein YcjF (UPF0283 family)